MFGKWPDKSFSEEKHGAQEESNCQERAASPPSNQSKFKEIQSNVPFNPERACTYLNATGAQWRNVRQQYGNNDGGIFRRQSASYATWSREHVGPTAAGAVGFSTPFYSGLNRQRQSPEVGEYEQLFFYSKEQNTHCPRKGRIFFVWFSQLQRSI